MKKARILLSLLLMSVVLQGCTPPPPQTIIGKLKGLHSDSIQLKGSSSSLRRSALHESALTLATQEALAVQSEQINQVLDTQDHDFSLVYNFTGLLLPHHILPPILVRGDNAFNLASDTTIRISDVSYKIIQQARFVTTAPTWRDYLWMNYQKPSPPDNAILPKTEVEKAAWQKDIDQGWIQGTEQANTIFNNNLARLKRDYKGMVLYHQLLAQHMVSLPSVVKTTMGITGGGNEMHINDRALRIAALPSLDPHGHTWKAALKYGYYPISPK